jgi:hypothetical protein
MKELSYKFRSIFVCLQTVNVRDCVYIPEAHFIARPVAPFGNFVK